MPITELDAKTALVVIDLQKGIVAMAPADVAAEVVARSGRLAEAFRARGLPVVLVHVVGGAQGRTESPRPPREFPEDFNMFVPELKQQPGDMVVAKRSWGAFTNTDLEERLRGAGVTNIVLVGVATSIGVESTARQAYELGFNVTLAVDAMADLRIEAHRASIALIFPRLGETGTTEDIIGLLGKSH